MTKEDRELLLKDLSARLPYGVQAEGLYEEYNDNDEIVQIKTCGFITCITHGIITIGINDNYKLDTVKPYLRPLSSMTDEEERELSKKYVWNINCGQIEIRYHCEGYWDDDTECPTKEYLNLFDWLNAHHFDYRGLIEKGLALEAPEGMYKEG